MAAIISAIWFILRPVFRVLKVFHLRPAVVIFLVGLILYFAGVFEENPAVKIVFYITFSASILYALIATVNKIFKPTKKKKKRTNGNVQILDTDLSEPDDDFAEENKAEEENVLKKEKPQELPPQKIYPKYYAVKGKPGYYFAEYPDKTVLYKRTEKGFVYIRTDYIKR